MEHLHAGGNQTLWTALHLHVAAGRESKSPAGIIRAFLGAELRHCLEGIERIGGLVQGCNNIAALQSMMLTEYEA